VGVPTQYFAKQNAGHGRPYYTGVSNTTQSQKLMSQLTHKKRNPSCLVSNQQWKMLTVMHFIVTHIQRIKVYSLTEFQWTAHYKVRLVSKRERDSDKGNGFTMPNFPGYISDIC